MKSSLVLTLAVSALATVSACAGPDASGIQVTDAFCRPTIAERRVTACYMTLTAGANDRLVAASTPSSSVTTLHSMSMESGVMRMAPMPDGLALPAGKPAHLKPGGDHLMLERLTGPLRVGDRVRLTLTFEKAVPVTVVVPVSQPPARDDHGSH